MGVAKAASKEIFYYARNFFLTVRNKDINGLLISLVRSASKRFLLRKKFYARSVHLEPVSPKIEGEVMSAEVTCPWVI